MDLFAKPIIFDACKTRFVKIGFWFLHVFHYFINTLIKSIIKYGFVCQTNYFRRVQDEIRENKFHFYKFFITT